MTAGIVLVGAPSCAAKTGTYKLEKRSGAAQGGSKRYREVVINGAYHSGSYQGAFERLERSDAKVSRAVLMCRSYCTSFITGCRVFVGGRPGSPAYPVYHRSVILANDMIPACATRR
jgi:hypothetical protein